MRNNNTKLLSIYHGLINPEITIDIENLHNYNILLIKALRGTIGFKELAEFKKNFKDITYYSYDPIYTRR